MFWHVFTSEAHVYVFPIVTGKGCQCNSLQPSLHLCFDSSNLKVSKTSRVRVWINGLSLFFSILRVHFCRYFLGLYFIRESVLDMGIYSYIYIHVYWYGHLLVPCKDWKHHELRGGSEDELGPGSHMEQTAHHEGVLGMTCGGFLVFPRYVLIS